MKCRKVLSGDLLAYFRRAKSGGDNRDRTDDLLNANQALSQLSYVPVEIIQTVYNKHHFGKWWA